MSQVTSRINLGAKIFPFIARNQGRSIIVPQYDNNFNRQTYSPEDQDKDIGIPQAYYMHNVMPTAAGLQSVGYIQATAAQGTDLTFSYILKIKDDIGHNAILGICTSGAWYIIEQGHDSSWRLLYTSAFPANLVYISYCQGTTYIYQKGTGANTYSFATHLLVPVTFTALDTTRVTGITAAFGYNIAWTTAGPSGGTFIGDTTNGSNYIKWDSGPVPALGSVLSGTGIQVGSTVTAYKENFIGHTFSIIISLPCTATNTNVTITIGNEQPGGIFWSSTIDPTDFTPSLITGAGGGEVEQAEGVIIAVFPHVKGLLVYCDNNIVAGPYSANPRFPFDFQAIPGAGGITDPTLITQEPTENQHYAYTNSGVQLVTMLGSNIVFPEVSDFISGGIFEDFNDSTLKFTWTELTAGQFMFKKMVSVLNRYLCFSYGIVDSLDLTHVIIYDQVQKRWGKLKFTHSSIVELDPDNWPTIDVVKNGIGLLAKDGSINYVTFDPEAAASNGTLILGKYQFVRARNLILDQIDLETIYASNKFTLTVFSSFKGKDFDITTNPTLDPDGRTPFGSATYFVRVEGLNHSILCQGQFSLDSGVLKFHIGGKR